MSEHMNEQERCAQFIRDAAAKGKVGTTKGAIALSSLPLSVAQNGLALAIERGWVETVVRPSGATWVVAK